MEFKVNDKIRFKEDIIEDYGLTSDKVNAVKGDTGVVYSIAPTGYYVATNPHWSPFFVRPEQIAPTND